MKCLPLLFSFLFTFSVVVFCQESYQEDYPKSYFDIYKIGESQWEITHGSKETKYDTVRTTSGGTRFLTVITTETKKTCPLDTITLSAAATDIPSEYWVLDIWKHREDSSYSLQSSSTKEGESLASTFWLAHNVQFNKDIRYFWNPIIHGIDAIGKPHEDLVFSSTMIQTAFFLIFVPFLGFYFRKIWERLGDIRLHFWWIFMIPMLLFSVVLKACSYYFGFCTSPDFMATFLTIVFFGILPVIYAIDGDSNDRGLTKIALILFIFFVIGFLVGANSWLPLLGIAGVLVIDALIAKLLPVPGKELQAQTTC